MPQRFLTYLQECLRLLYWTYFKPYTFRQWLREIHPTLDINENPFKERAAFADNPRLKRYADQVKWLAMLVPILISVPIGLLYSLLSSESFNWTFSIVFLAGWVIGILIGTSQKSQLKKLFIWVFWILMGLVGAFILAEKTGIFGEIHIAVSQGSKLIALLLLLAGGVAGGVAVGVAVGVAFGVAFGVTIIAGVLRLWFWLPELIWMLGLFFLPPPRYNSQVLRYLPTTIDELIILPLPFMDRLIIRAYHENPAIAQQTITHLTTHTNQQKVAARAMVGIAIDTLNQAKTATDISLIATELRWLPSPPPAAVGQLLPKLLDISRDVQAALNATTPYLRSEFLNKPLTDLQNLAQQLAFSNNAHHATQFGSIIPKWQTCLQTAKKNLAQQKERSQEIPLVYVAGPVLNPSISGLRFRGRIDLFREIEHLMLATQPPILLLHGGRRTGKTSLIKHLPAKVGSHFLPLLVDCQGAASLTTLTYLAKYIAKQAIQSAREDHNLTLPAADEEVLKEEPFYALQKWLDEVEKTVENRRILLCLDEFERLSEIIENTGSRAPLNFLRHIMQHRQQWVLLFSGAHLIQELPDYWNDYLINTRALKVSYLDEADARLLITTPIEEFPDIYAPAAIDAIIHWTRCQPYLVQLLCHTIVEQLNQNKRRYAEAHDVTAAIPKALQSGHTYFNELWRLRLSEIERKMVQKVLADEQFTESDKPILQALMTKEVIEAVQNHYQCQVPMIKEFIAQEID
jgi:hypothetical protein